jgi:Cu+-exporting ATPase
VLRLAASLERGSEHPLAAALVAAAEARSLPLASPTEFASKPGRGIEGSVDGKRVVLGTLDFVRERGSEIEPWLDQVKALQEGGSSIIGVAIEGRFAGLVTVHDPIRPTSRDAVQQLRREGVRLVMATGDALPAAQAVAAALGIEEVHAGLLPEDKLRLVEKLRQEGRIVAMAGDGVNDAPALARAHVGVVMSTGSDVAIGSAGVTLVGGDLRGIVRARRLSRATVRNIRENLFFAFVYNVIGVPLAAGVLYPVFGLLLSPMVASAAMSASSVSVIANALRLRRVAL